MSKSRARNLLEKLSTVNELSKEDWEDQKYSMTHMIKNLEKIGPAVKSIKNEGMGWDGIGGNLYKAWESTLKEVKEALGDAEDELRKLK